VHPEHQGKGIATALVQSGMKEAEKLGLDVFIQAMQAGLGVYTRLGFHIEREIVQNDSKFGGPGDFSDYLMIFEQKQAKQYRTTAHQSMDNEYLSNPAIIFLIGRGVIFASSG
jgi:ribosomal protein S18 acetylase RimI-like enzyme